MMQTPLRLTALLCGFSMISQTEWIRYRIPKTHAIFGDGYRMLTDDDVLQDGDETGCMSTLLSIDCPEKWVSVMPEWADDIGKPISAIINMDSPDADRSERLFRRRVAT